MFDFDLKVLKKFYFNDYENIYVKSIYTSQANDSTPSHFFNISFNVSDSKLTDKDTFLFISY